MPSDSFYMRLALENAMAMKGQTDPNPLVGAVIVNDHRIVGIGSHMKAGEPHAEIHALRMAGEEARGATIYVTLEPCSHHGRTGPCALALVEAGVRKVVVATLDPNPLVAGNGINILEQAGIEVVVGIEQDAATNMNEVFNKFILTKMPFVTMKSGMTLDGKVATYANSSKWITSSESREDSHRLRHEHGAILVGVNTVEQDDPELTTRLSQGRNPVRIIMDSKLRIPLNSKVVNDKQAETWIFTGAEYDEARRTALQELGVTVVPTSSKDHVDPVEVLTYLGAHHISSVLIEGGGTINAAFFEKKLVDKVVIYVAMKLAGGKNAPTILEGTGIEHMGEAVSLEMVSVDSFGNDIRITGYPTY